MWNNEIVPHDSFCIYSHELAMHITVNRKQNTGLFAENITEEEQQ